MGKRARIGLFASAMAVAVTGRGCVTTPPPVAESVVAGTSKPVAESGVAGSSTPGARSSSSLTAGDAVGPDVPAPPAPAQTPPPPAPQTPDERRAALDKQLDDSL